MANWNSFEYSSKKYFTIHIYSMNNSNHHFSMNINGRFARISTVSKRKEDELLHSGIQNAIKFGLVSDGTYGRYDTKS